MSYTGICSLYGVNQGAWVLTHSLLGSIQVMVEDL